MSLGTSQTIQTREELCAAAHICQYHGFLSALRGTVGGVLRRHHPAEQQRWLKAAQAQRSRVAGHRCQGSDPQQNRSRRDHRSQIAPGSLTGSAINLATLGKVPAAAVADSAGVARVKTVTAAGTAVADSGVTATATCDPGLTVVGGGAKLSDENNQLVNDSYPSGTNGWTVDVFASPSSSAPFTVYAICLPAASTS